MFLTHVDKQTTVIQLVERSLVTRETLKHRVRRGSVLMTGYVVSHPCSQTASQVAYTTNNLNRFEAARVGRSAGQPSRCTSLPSMQ